MIIVVGLVVILILILIFYKRIKEFELWLKIKDWFEFGINARKSNNEDNLSHNIPFLMVYVKPVKTHGNQTEIRLRNLGGSLALDVNIEDINLPNGVKLKFELDHDSLKSQEEITVIFFSQHDGWNLLGRYSNFNKIYQVLQGCAIRDLSELVLNCKCKDINNKLYNYPFGISLANQKVYRKG